MSYKFNSRYKALVEQLGTGKNNFLVDPYKYNTLQAYICKGISIEYDKVDKLRSEIEALKLQHLDEILELKEKLSTLIDQNYKLHELHNKEVAKLKAAVQNYTSNYYKIY